MADEWKERRLSEVMDVTHGFAFPGEGIGEEPSRDILLTPGNFAIGGGFKGDKFKYFDGEVAAEYVLMEGDLVITMTDLSKQSDTLGYPALVPRSEAGTRFLHNQRVGKVIIKPDADVDKRFILYLLRTSEYRHEVLASATGTSIKHTSPTRVLAYKTNFPPLKEQRAIACILGALDDKIELNRRMNRTLEAMARAIFKSWFVDFDPVRAKAAGQPPPGLTPALAALFPDRFEGSELGEIPRGWKVTTISDLAEVVGGSTPSTKEPAFWEGGTHHWATPKDLSPLAVPVLLETERRITDDGLAEIGSGLHPPGSVLLSSRAPIGYLAINQVPVAVNQGFIVMRPRDGVSAQFLLRWAEVAHETILSRANGSTFLEISKAAFRPIQIVAPDAPMHSAFDRVCRPAFDRVVTNATESGTLAALRDALLPKLISGELRVPDAERIVGRNL